MNMYGISSMEGDAHTYLSAFIGRFIPSPRLYAAVVSSQFDADRLDYLRRDRYMTGIKIGDFDMDWLLDWN